MHQSRRNKTKFCEKELNLHGPEHPATCTYGLNRNLLHLDPRLTWRARRCPPSAGLVGLDGALQGPARPSRDPENTAQARVIRPPYTASHLFHIPWELDMKRLRREVVRRDVLACVGIACAADTSASAY